MAPTQTPTQLAAGSEALELSVPVHTVSAVSNGREGEPSGWLAAPPEEMVGELDAGNPHVQFDEGAQETCDSATRLCPTLPQPLAS